ncbi:helix-turn-helix domain-containing protein [Gryllotalpicola koreensis]|uniref:TetR/AcrR family transcriptional regulator n=1 Tax=Gryllotalpicola koreensis TaxID=993086 RepID=A0ABP8A056_9MICO
MLRSDAQENRDRVLEAARELFAEHGLGVTMRDVARRAEVGPATLYRRFPTKRSLIDAAFADELHACEQIVDDGCTDPDPWRGFCAVIERLNVLNSRNQGFVDAFMSASPEVAVFADHRAGLLRKLAELGARAQAAGGLRADYEIDDLLLVLMAGRGLAAAPADKREAAARRFAALAIAALSASETNAPLPRGARLAPHLVGRASRAVTR